ncbi:MAG: IS5/IS1182 family transposase, partial [Deinococcota bacterium]
RRLKVFRVLKETYRHRRRRFALRLTLIAALYNLDLVSP